MTEKSEWMPIESAPKDGSRVFLLTEKTVVSQHDYKVIGTEKTVFIARYSTWDGYWRSSETGEPLALMSKFGDFWPTHWMPLPELPSAP